MNDAAIDASKEHCCCSPYAQQAQGNLVREKSNGRSKAVHAFADCVGDVLAFEAPPFITVVVDGHRELV